MPAAVLAVLVPLLVKAAEALFSKQGSGQEKHAWVHGMTSEIFQALDHFLPSFLKPVESELQSLVDQAIEAALGKIVQ